MPTFLHVGSGTLRKDQTTAGFNTPDWSEIRLDIDPAVIPDIISTMTDMYAVYSGSIDAIFSSHNIEHLNAYEVPVAFGEFKRVLADDGFLVITCPDLKSVCALIADDKLTETAYVSPAGPIAPIDMLFGHRESLAKGKFHMAHRCGFTEKILRGTLRAAGFLTVDTMARGAPFFDLWALASVSLRTEAVMRLLKDQHFPRSV
jgi:predicted SAM-dependent methyltransferase